jgi:hypothetical protein
MMLKDIRAKARDIGVKNHSRLEKTDLIRAIQEKREKLSAIRTFPTAGNSIVWGDLTAKTNGPRLYNLGWYA